MSRIADSSLTLKRKRVDTPKLSEDERKVYDLIMSTVSTGIWKGDLKYRLKLADNVVNKSIKSLKDKRLIKEVVNIQNKAKKHFMGFDFVPSVDLTGGDWYDKEGKLDKELIEQAKKQCLLFISRSKVATVGEITEAINNLPLFTEPFTGVQIEELVQSLILDKAIVEAQSTGKGDFAKIPPGEQCYQCSNKRGLPKTGALASIPCGVCPRLNVCTPDGVISPTTCVYFKKCCLKVIFDILENLSKPEVNALLHEFGFKLLYELCTDQLTSGPTMDLLSSKKYHFFLKHLYTIGVSALPKRKLSQVLRISSLHGRAWLLKLLALELHVGDMTTSVHREAWLSILGHLFAQNVSDFGSDLYLPKNSTFQTNVDHPGIKAITKSKVLELLEVVQFRCPGTFMKSSQLVPGLKSEFPVESMLGDPTTSEKSGVYHFSEHGDRLIDLASFCGKLWQKSKFINPAMSSVGGEADVMDLRETIQVLGRWGWKYNKNLEEQPAQFHMLTSCSDC